jgi:hypothetical protein
VTPGFDTLRAMPHDLLPLAAPSGRILGVIVGVVLLVAGRRVFWLAVGALGFLAGMAAMEHWGAGLSPAAHLLVAIAAGVVGLLLAILLQKVAVALAGFFLGVVLTAALLPALGITLGPWTGLALAAGGLVVAALALGLFSLALVVLTAGGGASLLTEAIAPPAPWPAILLVALWVVGVLVQRRSVR